MSTVVLPSAARLRYVDMCLQAEASETETGNARLMIQARKAKVTGARTRGSLPNVRRTVHRRKLRQRRPSHSSLNKSGDNIKSVAITVHPQPVFASFEDLAGTLFRTDKTVFQN